MRSRQFVTPHRRIDLKESVASRIAECLEANRQGKEATVSGYSSDKFVQMDSVQKLLRFLSRPCADQGAESFESVEESLHDLTCAMEAELLGAELARHDESAKEISLNGVLYRWKSSNGMTYQAACGEVRITRSVYVPRGSDGGRAVCPLELRAGIIESWTPRAARIMTKSVALMTPAEASSLLGEIGGLNPSTSSLDRLPKEVSEKWEAQRVEFEAEVRSEETVSPYAVTMVISLDGVLAPMKGTGRRETRAAEGKQAKGPAGYREVGCGTVSLYDADGERLETKRFARMPEPNKKTLKQQLTAEARSIMATMPGLTVLFVCDGAVDNWTFVEDLKRELGIDDIHEVLDAFHVLERIKKALDTYHGEGSPKSKGVFEELRETLIEQEDGIKTVLRALRYRRNKCRGNKRRIIEEQIQYLQRHQHLMPYAALRKQKLPIGSGVVEAACKTLVTQRLKRSGMSWGHEGGQAVITLRALIQSGRWESAWRLIANEYVVAVDDNRAA